MRIGKGTIGLLVALALVGILGVAMASVALGKQAAEPRMDAGDLAGIGEVVWGNGAGSRALSSSMETTPVIDAVTPKVKAVGSSAFVMTVTGSSFVSTSTVLWNGGALANSLAPTASEMKVNVPAVRVGALQNVFVRVETGSKVSTGTVEFTITQPTIASVTPTYTASAVTTATVITVTGTHLKDGLDAPRLVLKGTGPIAGTTIDGTGVSATNDTTMGGTFNLAAAPSGVYDVVLTYGDTGLVTKSAAFTINNPLPTITTISPATVYAGSAQPLLLTVNGTGFSSGAGGSTIKMGTAALSTTFVSTTQLTAPLTVATATVGTVAITVVNPAPGGGTSNAVNLTVASDTTKPVTSITGADSAWHNAPVVLTVTATDAQSGVQKTQYYLNGGTPTALVGSTVTVPADGTMDGEITVTAWSTDWCGNVESPAPEVTVKIDTIGAKTYAYAPATVKKGRKAKATFSYRANDVTPKCNITLKIKYKKSGKVARTYKLGSKPSGTRLNYRVKPNLAKGTYILYVYAVDQAGNKQSKLGTDTFRVK